MSRHNLSASIGRNTLFGLVSNFAQLGTRLITVPVVIHYLGLSGSGIWNVIMMAGTYMRFGSVGVKTAFQKYVAEATGNGNYERANRLLSTGCALMFVFSVAILIPVSWFAERIARAAGVPAEFLSSAAGSISLLAVIMMTANVGAAYEAIVMGGHRIDLVRKFGTVLTCCEAVAIIVVLRLGFGLFAMAAVMGVSELLYIICCYFASRRVLPQIQIRAQFLDLSVLRELFRFAGSYQLLNLLEVVYSSVIPLALLRVFGATAAGVYAVVTRVATSAGMLQDAFLGPILSGATMVFASGSAERMYALIRKAFKVTLGIALLPLGFIAAFGPTLAYAWTGQEAPAFRATFWLVCFALMFRALSMLSFVLYRTSGRALLDNVVQLVRTGCLVVVVMLSRQLGFYGLLAGMVITEFLGMNVMLVGLGRTFTLFRAQNLIPDAMRLITAAVMILGAGALASHIPVPGHAAGRLEAALKLVEIGLGCLLVAWPALALTGSVTGEEGRALFSAFIVRTAQATPALAHPAGE
jgi:O-antigen/teichoic acid export membrane protein